MKIEIKPNCDMYDQRFIIVDDDGKLLDDAQGYGYKSKQKAIKAMWYKFKGGKQKINQKQQERKKFFNQYKGLEKFLDKIYENNYKEISRGEVTNEDILAEIKKEFNVDMPKEYLTWKYD